MVFGRSESFHLLRWGRIPAQYLTLHPRVYFQAVVLSESAEAAAAISNLT